MCDVRNVDRQLLLPDTARLAHARPGMPLGDVHALHDEPPLLGKYTQHLAGPALVAAADDDDVVALLDLQLRHASHSGRYSWGRAPLRPSGGRGRGPSHRDGRVRWAPPQLTGPSAPSPFPLRRP